jgi:hypothetical protein
VVSPVLVIVPEVALPFWTPSTSHKTVPVPPVRVAVMVRDCEVVTAESLGESATVMLEVGGGFVGGGFVGGGVDGGGLFEGGVEVVPPPHEVKPGANRIPTIARARAGIFFRSLVAGKLRSTDSIQVSPYKGFGANHNPGWGYKFHTAEPPGRKKGFTVRQFLQGPHTFDEPWHTEKKAVTTNHQYLINYTNVTGVTLRYKDI